MVLKRQIRKFHEDAHYASAIFRYEKEMAIKYRRFTTFVSLGDKHKVPVGDCCRLARIFIQETHVIRHVLTITCTIRSCVWIAKLVYCCPCSLE